MDTLDDTKMLEEEDSNKLPENMQDSKNKDDEMSPVETKPAGRRKGGVSRGGDNLRGASKTKKTKLAPTKKEQGLSKDRVFLYKPFIPLPDLSEYVNTLIEVKRGLIYLIFVD